MSFRGKSPFILSFVISLQFFFSPRRQIQQVAARKMKFWPQECKGVNNMERLKFSEERSSRAIALAKLHPELLGSLLKNCL